MPIPPEPGRRLVRPLAALVLAAVLAVLAVVLATSGSGRRPTGSAPAFAGAAFPPGVPAHPFSLTDEEGRTLTLSSLRGQPVILTFLDARNPITAPVVADQIRGALDELARPVPAVAITDDPSLDTPSATRAFLAAHGLLGRLRMLLGPRSALPSLWRAYGVSGEDGRPRSSEPITVILLDRAGRERVGFPEAQLTPESLAHDVRLLDGS